MEDSDNKLIKNKPALIAGLVPALFFILFGNELLQAAVAFLVDIRDVKLDFHILFVSAGYSIPLTMHPWLAYITLLSPLLVSLLLIQAASLALYKVPLGFYRYTLMIFQLFILGYVLLYLLYGTISVALRFDWNTDIQKFTEFIGVEYPVNLFVVFLMIFIIGLFINFNVRRVSAFINK